MSCLWCTWTETASFDSSSMPYNTSTYVSMQQLMIMMTSSNGNIFRVTGHLCEELTGDRWIPRTKASDAELSLICARINAWVNNDEAGDLRRHRAHYDVTVMIQGIQAALDVRDATKVTTVLFITVTS